MKTKSPLLPALCLLLASTACATKDANTSNSTENTAKPAASANTTAEG
jgi:hypothetical protein